MIFVVVHRSCMECKLQLHDVLCKDNLPAFIELEQRRNGCA